MQIPENDTDTTTVCEIIETPRWKIVDMEELFSPLKNNGTNRNEQVMPENGEMSDKAFAYRHRKFELEEKVKRISKTFFPPENGMPEQDAPGPGEIKSVPTLKTGYAPGQSLKSVFHLEGDDDHSNVSVSFSTGNEDEPKGIVDPWPRRKFPLSDEEHQDMIDDMQQYFCTPE